MEAVLIGTAGAGLIALFGPPPAAQHRLGLPKGASLRYATRLACYRKPFRAVRFGLRQHSLPQMLRAGPFAGRNPASQPAPVRFGDLDPIATER